MRRFTPARERIDVDGMSEEVRAVLSAGASREGGFGVDLDEVARSEVEAGIRRKKSQRCDCEPLSRECNVVPARPLRLFPKLVLTLTEVPFLILWSYAVYWVEVCLMVGRKAPVTVWWSAGVAGFLVGLGLNANAYRALHRPMSRSRKKRLERKRGLLIEAKKAPDAASLLQRLSEIIDLVPSPRYLNTTYLGNHTTTSDSPDIFGPDLELQDKYPQNKPSTTCKARMVSPDSSYPMCWSEDETVIDYGMIMRFFLIPFAVSSLSGLTNSAREDFVLVFPRDKDRLLTTISIPAMVVLCLLLLRVLFILKLNIRPTFKVFFLNGKLLL